MHKHNLKDHLVLSAVFASLAVFVLAATTKNSNHFVVVGFHSTCWRISRLQSEKSSILSSPTTLFAIKKKQKKSQSTKSASAGGFGGSTSKSKTLEGKVRSVSGHTGSGTKPLRQAANNFDDLRKEYGQECCKDLWCRSPLNDPLVLWFIGKVAGTSSSCECFDTSFTS
jgi:hypothetical protein